MHINFPYIWILDISPMLSAKSLTDKDLAVSIKRIVDLLLSVYVYTNGIHSKKLALLAMKTYGDGFYTQHFPYFPTIKGYSAQILSSARKLVKWTSQSRLNFDIIVMYFAEYIKEYTYRFKKLNQYQYLEEYFLQYPPSKLKYIKSQPLEEILSKIKIPAMYRCHSVIDSLKKWYKSKCPKALLLKMYSQEIPEWLLS